MRSTIVVIIEIVMIDIGTASVQKQYCDIFTVFFLEFSPHISRVICPEFHVGRMGCVKVVGVIDDEAFGISVKIVKAHDIYAMVYGGIGLYQLVSVLVSRVHYNITVCGIPERPINIKTAPHPGYPTDLQPQISPLMAKYFGGIIDERVWQNRFSYLDTLQSFGVHHRKSTSRAVIFPSDIRYGMCDAPDLRGGAAALMCALAASGESEIGKYEIIKRGYENIALKLNTLGAKAFEIND